MTRFFFHVFDDVELIDDEGIEFGTVEEARAEALRSARSLMCEQVQQGRLNLHHRIELEDEEGRPVLTLPFSAAVTIED